MEMESRQQRGLSGTTEEEDYFIIGTASGTSFGCIPVCCCLSGSAWLRLDVSPNHVPEAMRH